MEVVKVKLGELGVVSPLFDAYRVFYGQKSNSELAFDFLSQRVKNEES
ncbi:GNAT family N-acetyltransferase, partial [Aliivibrio sp. SR45-2]|nr:GNAT family N-acetyltransferase [Aliivibrio sp. SR45-2]